MKTTSNQRSATEATVETHLLKQVKALRGWCLKVRFIRGFPDRIVLLGGGRVVFFELKRPVGGVFEPLQRLYHAKLRALGFAVFVCNTKASVDAALESYVN